MPPDAPEPLPSATILLVRDGARGLEVFMVKRHHRIDFAESAMVFPGGKLEAGDADPGLRALCRGASYYDDAELTCRVGAIRETFEECGVLLARPRGEQALVSGERLREIETRHREALDAHSIAMPELVAAEDLELACDLLVPFAHWITPVFMPKRFDTWFYLVDAPPDHVAVHDGHESVDSAWIRPGDAVAEEEAGRLTIIFPTMMQVKKLGRSDTTARALEAARDDTIVTVLPSVTKTDAGPVMRIPAEAGYDVVEAPLDALR
jgi:8-oxo-dGTP pyrophosphatase MutT (NUDIX family)